MRDLPYYKMWVKDFDTDENVRLMDVREAGLFLWCMNHAWTNNGLPANEADVGRLFKLSVRDFKAAWPRVSLAFPISEDGRRRNHRQEEEREKAQRVSQNNKRPGNANASRTRLIGDPNDPQHARARADYVSESVSVPENQKGDIGENAPFIRKPAKMSNAKISTRLQEWLDGYPRVSEPISAIQALVSVLTSENESAAFACRDRYLASAEVARGAISDACRFIFEQAKCNWSGKWPPANGRKLTPLEELQQEARNGK